MNKFQIQKIKVSSTKKKRELIKSIRILSMVYILIFSSNIFAQDIQTIRSSYFSLDEEDCGWMDFVESIDGNESAVVMAYQGSALAASAQCVNGPFNKLKQFNKGRDFLEKAVALEPDNVEIRFLRYQVKLESPRILNYKDLDEDESIVMKEAMNDHTALDAFLVNKIRAYLLNSVDLSYMEKQKIESLNQNSNRDG